MKALLLAVALLLPAGAALSLTTPKPGKHDPRVRYVDYNPADVVKLVAHFGYQIDIVLAEGESVLPRGIFMGDKDAWTFATQGNHVLVKPKEENGRTNMTILTNRRAYSFDLSSHWRKSGRSDRRDMYYQVNFRYPREDAARSSQSALRLAEQQRLAERLGQSHPTVNTNYHVQGSADLAPDEASDDGTFTRLTFKGNRDIPAIFIINADGSESLVNRTVEGKTVVIHALARKFILRKGGAVACVFNESFDPVGRGHPAGATMPGVQRAVKRNPS
ncbi:P-type conjugative transfer protein VirB9 [Massilia soli]|uniref:P-type conjugative transfer protein VirB9 n=1 Tax=Massilia soli TaxID=2792854 RepID=A0ABS7SLT7_9BURK|nr:P-type conjugative transfer protein VirB9 [Massilia soli]MBZ2207144.1 P-type conjugative transfer protein VirB9 [Massilia soli]